MQSALSLRSLQKIGLLGSLYLSQGLPFGFFIQALPIWIRESGSSLGVATLSSLLALPWALKFIWAPLVDRRWSASFGRRRSWILPMQAATVLVLIGTGFGASKSSIGPLVVAVFVVNLLSATQDIATDGFAVDMLDEHERGLGNGVQVGGYRVGMAIGGGALLKLLDDAGFRYTLFAMALILVLATIPILGTREPPPKAAKPLGGPAPPEVKSVHFLRRPGALQIIALLALYKLGEAFASNTFRLFLRDAGLSLGQIGMVIGTVGFVAGLVGAILGGALVNRLGRKPALVGFAVIQLMTVAGYAVVARGKPGLGELYAISAAEHLGSGMATAALFTCMMDWCEPESATDYTVQACAVVIATGLASAVSGFSADALGYFTHFCVATAVALGGVLAAIWLFPRAGKAASS